MAISDRLHPNRDTLSRFAVDELIDNSTSDFDLYLEINGIMTLYARAPYKWLRDEISRLLNQGHKELFYFSSDQARVDAYNALHKLPEIDTKSEPRQRIANLTDAAAEMTRVLFDHPLTMTAMEHASEISKAMVDCIEEDRSCVTAIGNLARHDDYTYYHSARVAAYSLAIALQLSATERLTLEDMALGCLLHDVGKSKIDITLINKQGAFTKEDWEIMRQHPTFGIELVEKSLLGTVPRHIILHHHERFDGSGYPHGLSEHELFEEVKIAGFADVFDALTTNRPYQVSRTRFEALDFIRHKLLKNIHRESFEAMVDLLNQEQKKGS